MAKFLCNVISYTLCRTVDITVVVPTPTIPEAMGMGGVKPRHTPKTKYPVLYLLHGFGNNDATWTGYTNVEFFAEERNMAVVMISAENKSYVDGPSGDKFFEFISEELPDFVRGMFPISDRPEDTYIAGLSMGGFGTFVHALNAPEKYCALGAFSAAISINPAELSGIKGVEINPRFSPEVLAEKLASSGAKFPKVYMACGAKDVLYNENKKFRDKLISLGANVTWDEMPEYGHEWRFWNLEIERFLDWIPRTDDYAKKGAKRQI